MKFVIVHKRLFIQKLSALLVTTVLLAPLIYYKVTVPAALFVSGLLLVHIIFFYVYFSRTPWRILLAHKAEFALRLTAVLFFIYLLSLIHFGGAPLVVITKIMLATAIHAAILTGMMLQRVATRRAYGHR